MMVVMNIWRCALPDECHGRIFALCSRGKETVNCLIDACLTRAEQEAALWHELAHLLLFHYESALPLCELEREADEISFLMTGTKLQEKVGGG